jgi:tungstate transport system substrate-binding protein
MDMTSPAPRQTPRRRRLLALASFTLATLGLLATPLLHAQDKTLVMASTTSTEQSGLFGHLLPAFKQATGIDVRVVALGTGQALDTGRRGDADIVFVHDQVAEEKFVAEGFGLKRMPVMYNDFVVIGPKADPAGAKGKDITAALARSLPRAIPSSRAGTRAAPTLPNCATGRPPASTSPPPSPGATRSAAAAWARR